MSDIAVSLVASLSGAVIVVAAQRIRANLLQRPLRTFWHGFENQVYIVTTEYKIQEWRHQGSGATHPSYSDEALTQDERIARSATSGYFISYAMAMSMALLKRYFERTLNADVVVIGDKGHFAPREMRSIVVLGSPANNRYLQGVLRDFSEHYPLLSHFRWEVGESGVILTLPDGGRLIPEIDDSETGIDYAFVASLIVDSALGSRLIMISGSNMWGTEAATRLLLDPKLVKQLPTSQHRQEHRGFAFVVRTRISHGSPQRTELLTRRDGPAIYWL